ncbi:MAG: lamin tail domain-containing protein [Deltaproteobacteria bacterium]|nr:lamin tail domain-containing protein [Deltaproteobacteria bacterium]
MHHIIMLMFALSLMPACGPAFPDLEDRAGGEEADAIHDGDGAVTCGAHEAGFPGPVCVSRSRDLAAFRFASAGPCAGTVWCRSTDGSASASRHDEISEVVVHHDVVSGLVPAAAYECTYGITAGVGSGSAPWTVIIEPGSPGGPVITEVLLNPAGPEPAQEFVEVANPGPDAIDIGGYLLHDDDPDAPDEIPEGTAIPAGGVVLLVAEGFVTDGPDPSPAEGCPLVRLDGSLGRSGLRNSGGESVYLLSPDGSISSFYPNVLGTTGQGVSAHRVSVDAPDGDEANWKEGPPTPGVVTGP